MMLQEGMFSVVYVFCPQGGGSHVTITHEALDLTRQGPLWSWLWPSTPLQKLPALPLLYRDPPGSDICWRRPPCPGGLHLRSP